MIGEENLYHKSDKSDENWLYNCTYVYERLRANIMSGCIQANERILECEYAEKFGVSRTPVREALCFLEQDGLVKFKLKREITAWPLLTRNNMKEILQLKYVEDTINNLTRTELAATDEYNDEMISSPIPS